MLSFITLLFISLGAFSISRKTNLPYTVLLVLIGLLLIPIAHTETFAFIKSFQLTPDLLFFVFLPTLIFESAYNMNARKVFENIWSISLLSIVSLIVSTAFIAGGLYYASNFFGFPLPFIVTLLFGALISATDPVAVLALFKEYGAPKRLALIFEGESLFNDGTSLALFLIILEIIAVGWSGISSFAEGMFMFTTMVLGGIAMGGFMGALFSKLIERVHNNEHTEITLTMIVAHFTFIFSEIVSHSLSLFGHSIHISSIIATVVAAMVVGNYGRYKISPRVEESMEKFWGYFAFVVNSIVFILIGLLFESLSVSLVAIAVPIVIAVLIVMIGRALSIYPVIGALNWMKKEDHIPRTWQHLMAWGSLRGALAVTMVLLIPDTLTLPNWHYDISIKDFITALTIGCIYFTLFIKATTIGPLIKKLKIDALTPIEKTEHEEGKALIYAKVLREIERFSRKGYISTETQRMLQEKYETQYRDACTHCKNAMGLSPGIPEKMLLTYALGVARHSLKTLFFYKEISERVYKKILQELEKEGESGNGSERGQATSPAEFAQTWFDTLSDAVVLTLRGAVRPPREKRSLYMYHRAHAIIAQKAIEELHALKEGDVEIFEDTSVFMKVIARHEHIKERAASNAQKLLKEHPVLIEPLVVDFAEAGLFKAEEKILHELCDKEILSPKIAITIEGELSQTTKNHSA